MQLSAKKVTWGRGVAHLILNIKQGEPELSLHSDVYTDSRRNM